MAGADDVPSPAGPPAWALRQAAEELYDTDDDAAVVRRAEEITRDRAQREDERHDEYDDPDEGGEG